jgi:tetratricopeptide (TPR) repeat protein
LSTPRTDPRSHAEALLARLATERDTNADSAQGIQEAVRAERLAKQSGWEEGRAFALLQLARRQEPGDALATLQRAIRIFRRLGHTGGEADALNNLALLYGHRGQTTLAVHFLTLAHELMQQSDSTPPHDRALLLLNLAIANFEQDRSETAISLAGESIDLCRRHQLDDLLARTLWMTGRALWRRGHDHLALHYEREALRVINRVRSLPWDRAEAESAFAEVSLDLGMNRDARDHGAIASELFARLNDEQEQGIATLALGIASLHLGDEPQAEIYFEQALALGRAAGSDRIRACALRMLGDLKIQSGDPAAGIELGREALAIGERCGNPVMQGLAHAVLYRAEKERGDASAALRHLERALTLARGTSGLDSEPRFGDLPIHEELEALWRRQAIYRMALPAGGG